GELVADDAGLHASRPAFGIGFEDLAHELRVIEDDGDIARLTGQARPASPRQDRGIVLAAGGNHRLDVARVAWQDDADRRLTVVRAVVRVDRAMPRVEAHLAPHLALEALPQGAKIDVIHATRLQRRAGGVRSRTGERSRPAGR